MGMVLRQNGWDLFQQKLDAKYFHVKQFFRKKQYFLGNRKILFWGAADHFVGNGGVLHKNLIQLFLSWGTKYFITKQDFSYYKKSFVGGHDWFERKGTSGDKNEYNLSCRKWNSEYFSSINFFKKKTKQTIFSIITMKNNFGGMTTFEGMGHRMTKMYNIFCWKSVIF